MAKDIEIRLRAVADTTAIDAMKERMDALNASSASWGMGGQLEGTPAGSGQREWLENTAAKASEAAAALGRVREAATATGTAAEKPLTEMELLGEQFSRLSTEATKAAGDKGTGGSGISALLPLLGEIGRLIPGVGGQLATLATSLGPVAGAAIAAAKAVEFFQEVSAKMDRAEQAWIDLGAAVAGNARELDAARAKAEEAAAAETRAANAAARVRQEYESLTGATMARVDALQREADALERTRKAEDELAAARADLAAAEAGDDPVKREEARVAAQRESRATETRRIKEDIEAARRGIKERSDAQVSTGQDAEAKAQALRDQAAKDARDAEDAKARAAAAEKDRAAGFRAISQGAETGDPELMAEGRRRRDAAIRTRDDANKEAGAKTASAKANEQAAAEIERSNRTIQDRLIAEGADLMKRVQELESRLATMDQIEPIRQRSEDLGLGQTKTRAAEEKRRRDEADARKREQEERAGDRERLGGMNETLDNDAEAAAGRMFRSRAGRTPIVRRVAGALENGTDATELARLAREVGEAAGKANPAILSALRAVIEKLTKQAREIEVLEKKLRNQK